MANANPTLRATPVNLAERSALPVHDPSPIKKNHGQETRKVRCEICDTKYGYDVDEGNSGCPDCEARIARREIQKERLARLEKQAAELEKENAEFDAKEKALKDRIKKAQEKSNKK